MGVSTASRGSGLRLRASMLSSPVQYFAKPLANRWTAEDINQINKNKH